MGRTSEAQTARDDATRLKVDCDFAADSGQLN